MAGYQVETPNFFVNLSRADNTENQIAFLQDTYKNPASVFITGLSSTAVDLYTVATGARNGIVGAFFVMSGTPGGNYNVTLPTAAAILADMSQEMLEQYGNQLINNPATQRAYLGKPAVGANFQFTIYNNTASSAIATLVEAAGGNTQIVAGTQIGTGDVGIVTATVIDPTGVADPSVTYVLNI